CRVLWPRDAYFVVRSLNRIGASRTMEDYINYILTIVTGGTGELQPVYSIVSTDPLEERIVADLKGYRGDGPVRIGNAAVAQNQHDTYGSAILAATPMFFARRAWGTKTYSACSSRSVRNRPSLRWSLTQASGNSASGAACTRIRSRCA